MTAKSASTGTEIEVIGMIIAAVETGRSDDLTPQAWLRVLNYAQNLINAEYVKAEAATPAAKVSALLGPAAARSSKRSDAWHVLGRRTKTSPPPPWKAP